MLDTRPAVQERWVEFDRYRVHYLEAGSGPPLLLVHGLGASVHAFSRNIPALAEKHRVIALDTPGHGRSPDPGPPYGRERGVEFLRRFILEVAGEPVAIAGNSAGGFLAAMMAAVHPELVTRLALLATPGFSRQLGWRLRFLALPLAPRFAAIDSPYKARAMLKGVLHDPSLITADLVDEILAGRANDGAKRAVAGAVRAGISLGGFRDWQVCRSTLAGISQPVLLVWGRQDRIIPPSVGLEAARLLPGAEFHLLDGCGHWPQFERADEVNRLLARFFAGDAL